MKYLICMIFGHKADLSLSHKESTIRIPWDIGPVFGKPKDAHDVVVLYAYCARCHLKHVQQVVKASPFNVKVPK